MIYEVVYNGRNSEGRESASVRVACEFYSATDEDQEGAFLRCVRRLNELELTGYAAAVNFPEISGYMQLTKGV